MTTLPATFQGSPTDEDGEPWIGYVRVSTWREEKISPELQRTAISQWARRTGRRIVRWVEDLDATGRNFKRKIMLCVDSVEDRQAVGIAVWKYSRFGRDRPGIAINLARVERVGGQLQSATEEVDATTAVGKFNRGILFEVAAFESDRAGEQWKETHAHRRALGLPATGRARLGYTWHPRRIPDPDRPGEWLLQKERYEINDDAPVVDQLYARKVDGDGFASLAAWLNVLGHRTSLGRKWQEDNLKRFMDAGFAAGLLRVHDPECRCNYTDNGHRCTRWVHIDGAHEAIITPETWEKYLAHRADTKERAPRARLATYTCTGLCRCGECRGGAAATSARRAGQQVKGYGYQCGQRGHAGTTICTRGVWIKRATVEDEVLKWIAREVAPAVDAAPAVPQQRPAVVDERARAEAERARLTSEIDRLSGALARLRAHRATDPDEYEPGEYEAARDHIRGQRDEARARLDALGQAEGTPDRQQFEPLLVGLLDEWELLDARARNAILRKVARRVVLTRVGDTDRTEVTVHPMWEPDPWAADAQ